MPHRPACSRLAGVLFLALLAACAATPEPASSTQPSTAAPVHDVNAFFAEFADQWMRRQPSAATGSRYFGGELQAQLDGALTPQTEAFEQETLALARQGLQRLAGFDRARMDDTTRVSAELMQWQLQTLLDGEPHRRYDFPLQQFGGPNVGLPNLMTVVHPIRDARDADNYLSRLRLFEARMDEATARSREQAQEGILPPRFILDATVAQMRQFIASPADRNPLVTTFAGRLESVESIDPERRAALVAQATDIVTDSIVPAWRRAIDVLVAQQALATDEAGLS